MKNFIVFAAVLVIMSVPALAFHPTTTSCNRCHIVHNSQTGSDVPLWSGMQTATTTFVKYTSDTLDTTPGEPAGSTLLCLACHDYTTTNTHAMNTSAGNLLGTHPIEIVYNTALVGQGVGQDDELKDPSVATVTFGDAVVGGTIADELLSGGDTVKCISCHDVHVQGLHEDRDADTLPPDPLDIGDYGIPHLQDIDGIRYTARGQNPTFASYSLKYGALCITCHIK